MLEDTNSLGGAHIYKVLLLLFNWCKTSTEDFYYRNDPKFSDRYVWANSADPDQTEEQSDQGLHCLPFRLHRLDSLLYGKATKFKF